jgi:hypothetical protein
MISFALSMLDVREGREMFSAGSDLRPGRISQIRLGQQGEVMKPFLAFFTKLQAMLAPPAQQAQSQRMCPFCGLITPRAKRVCLECGKAFSVVQVDPKEVKQEG